MMRIWIDGSGYNGERSGYCVYFEDGRCFEESFVEPNSNNMMEYLALYEALKRCSSGDEIFTDSQLVTKQVAGLWNCNFEHLIEMRDNCIELMKDKRITLTWIPRDENLAGKLIERGLNLSRLLRRGKRSDSNGNVAGQSEEEGRKEKDIQLP